MVIDQLIDENKIISYRRGDFISQDLKRVLDDSGDPYWVECLLNDFKNKFFKSQSDYFSFSDLIDFRKNFLFYMQEQKKRINEALALKSWKLGKKLDPMEEVQEIEENHISKDFRLYYLLEYPEFSAVYKNKLFSDPNYLIALRWLLINAERLDPNGRKYREIISKNSGFEI